MLRLFAISGFLLIVGWTTPPLAQQKLKATFTTANPLPCKTLVWTESSMTSNRPISTLICLRLVLHLTKQLGYYVSKEGTQHQKN